MFNSTSSLTSALAGTGDQFFEASLVGFDASFGKNENLIDHLGGEHQERTTRVALWQPAQQQ